MTLIFGASNVLYWDLQYVTQENEMCQSKKAPLFGLVFLKFKTIKPEWTVMMDKHAIVK
jgi:hypothetical protein